MKKVYMVDLIKEEKAELLDLVCKGEAQARKMNRAHLGKLEFQYTPKHASWLKVVEIEL